jgi:prepilin signal peptidase PulO-like enzyme (type II secretory pathway)
MILAVALGGGLCWWAPRAFERTPREFYASKWSKILVVSWLGLFAGFMLFERAQWMLFPWLSTLLVLALVDARSKSVRVIDLCIMSAAVVPLLSMRGLGQVGVSALFLVILMAVKFTLKKIYKQDALGGADVWVIVTILMALGGKPAMVAVYAGVILSAITGGFLMVVHGRSGKTTLPFIPFLALGAVIATFFSNPILTAYMNFITMQ